LTRVRGRRELVERLGRINKETQRQVRRALLRGGLRVENRAVEGIIDPPKTGRIYRSKHRKGKLHQASAPGEFPAADSGRLHQSITHAEVPAPAGTIAVEVAANAPYATFLELGTSKMEPRPFMAPALRENEVRIRNDIAEAVRRGSRKR
jgi:HK97 gp10 family phage protein